ncbi:MAG: hypothetical protein EOP07_23245, partial [Proteobacteria bacterium]
AVAAKPESPEASAPAEAAAGANPVEESVAIAAEDQVVEKAIELTLKVRLPSNDIREGGKKLQALAVLSKPSDSVILWSLESSAPAGTNIGSIDAKGLYTSPANITAKLDIKIVATLANDQTITDKQPLIVNPEEVIFVGCTKGNIQFPITADVFSLASGTAKLPDFSKMTKSDTVCLDKFDIPLQSWELGFPGAPELQEWFALSSKAKIILPSAGVYVFKTYSDDGSIVYIDSAKVVDNDGTHSATSKESLPATYTQGKHDIKLDWYQGPRTHIALQLFWKVPGSDKFVIVPSTAFSAN